jgi:3'-phosphoadenosine 5'-phosphosulfate sulfotransferase (PAPS reductase)/FAD synthetase
MKPVQHIVMVSGGKDSAAVATLALRRVPREQIRFLFVDTGNEHPETYTYLDRLEEHFGMPIERIRADFSDEFAIARRRIAEDLRIGRDKNGRKLRRSNRRKREALAVLKPTGNPFLDLCLLNGIFPSNSARFCTRRLKVEAITEHLLAAHEKGPMIVWQGTKRTDSDKRAHLRLYSRQAPGWMNFRPILNWTHDQVFAFLREAGTPINPLYGSGFSRVSCGPCIYSRKSEIALLADRYPEAIDRIREWERLVSAASKTGFAPFFVGKEIPATPAQRRTRSSIDGVVKWARVDFRKNKKASYADVFEESQVCDAGQGLCE